MVRAAVSFHSNFLSYFPSFRWCWCGHGCFPDLTKLRLGCGCMCFASLGYIDVVCNTFMYSWSPASHQCSVGFQASSFPLSWLSWVISWCCAIKIQGQRFYHGTNMSHNIQHWEDVERKGQPRFECMESGVSLQITLQHVNL